MLQVGGLPQVLVDNLPKVFGQDEFEKLSCLLEFLRMDDVPVRLVQTLEIALAHSFETFRKEVLKLVAKIEKCAQQIQQKSTEQLGEESSNGSSDEPDEFCPVMSSIQERFISRLCRPDTGNREPDWSMALHCTPVKGKVVQANLVRTLATMNPVASTQLVEQVMNAFGKTSWGPVMSRTAEYGIAAAKSSAGKVVGVGLAAIYLGYEAWKTLQSWWKGDISGARCAKILIDTGMSYLAGFGGGMAGAAIGTMIFPGVGTVVGSLVGGYAAASLAEVLVGWLTEKIFNVPKDQALENAFRVLGVSCNSSNGVINSAFRREALRSHPDKGGDREEFEKLQFAMGVIKLSKGDL